MGLLEDLLNGYYQRQRRQAIKTAREIVDTGRIKDESGNVIAFDDDERASWAERLKKLERGYTPHDLRKANEVKQRAEQVERYAAAERQRAERHTEHLRTGLVPEKCWECQQEAKRRRGR